MHVKDGRIAGVAPIHGEASVANLTVAAGLKYGLKTILNYEDLIISPGFIDVHVHLNEPGRTEWEGGNQHSHLKGAILQKYSSGQRLASDSFAYALTKMCALSVGFVTGTKAAAAGGTTSIVEMPLNAHPAVTTVELLLNKITASKVHQNTCHLVCICAQEAY